MRHTLISLVMILTGAFACQRDQPSPQALASEPAKKTAPRPRVRTARTEPLDPNRDSEKLKADLEESLVTLLPAKSFLQNLKQSESALEQFINKNTAPAEARETLASVTTHDLRSFDLRQLISQALASLPQPQVYQAADTLGYPRLFIVWQQAKFHKAIRVSNNNDNRAVSLFIGRGKFTAKTHGLSSVTMVATKDVLSLVPFVTASKSVWPHVENYYVCPPDCAP